MSDDIVKRLLMSCGPATERAAKLAAADEIERLRADLAAEREQLAQSERLRLALSDEYKAVRAENIKLREALVKAWVAIRAGNYELYADRVQRDAALDAIDAVLKETKGSGDD